MPVNYSWLVENRVLNVSVEGIISFEDIRQSVNEMLTVLDSANETIHIVSDQSGMVSVPHNVLEITIIMRPLFQHENMGYTLICGIHDKLFRIINIAISTITHAKVRFVESRDDMIHMLITLDPDLSDQLEKLSD